jgi:hypothetical protein
MKRRSKRSHELTPEERSRGGLHRAAKIRTAKLDAMAEGRPYKPTKRRRRRSRWSSGESAVSPMWREPEPSAPSRPTPRRFEELSYEEQAWARGSWEPVFVKRDDLYDPD